MVAIAQPELYRNFGVHLLVMAPAGALMAYIASRIDRVLGWSPLVAWPWSLLPGLSLILAGGLWVWYVYGYLFLSGRGSPGSHVDGGPTVLVDTGPYTMLRHPSVLGKVAGVLGLAMLFGSKVFLVAFLPLLVTYSLLTNRYLQERACDARFGASYARYRELVPMIVPRPAGLWRWLRDEGALGEAAPASGPSPRIAFIELRWYLVGLGCLIAFFAVVFWAVVAFTP
jgi:protein-S-isoprenylcysteine O-methyltransferase Ste14